jgi:hypothetical protein
VLTDLKDYLQSILQVPLDNQQGSRISYIEHRWNTQMPQFDDITLQALIHIRYLSETIGGRGSCTHDERRAADYLAEEMKAAGLSNVRTEPYRGTPSTYRPYAMAFGLALLSTLLAWLFTSRFVLIVAAIFNILGAQGMLAETDFTFNWMRRVLPTATSQNAVGTIPSSKDIRHRAILCAHIDTHRTPVFYSSATWHALFSYLVSGAFLSLILGALIYSLGALFYWNWVLWIGLVFAAVQIFALVLCLHADLTPFSPGANDNASGVGVILEIGKYLAAHPFEHTEVCLAFTGCEETAAYGMAAFLDAHADALGKNAVYIILDEVGLGAINYLTNDGLILKRPTHPQALSLARQAVDALQGIEVSEKTGIAYTDALVATKRGLIALTINAYQEPGKSEEMHWHQMSDTCDHVDPQVLYKAAAFTWQVLKTIDRKP